MGYLVVNGRHLSVLGMPLHVDGQFWASSATVTPQVWTPDPGASSGNLVVSGIPLTVLGAVLNVDTQVWVFGP